MTFNHNKNGITFNDEVDRVIRELTQVVEKEVRAFQTLLGVLQEQQTSILTGDAQRVIETHTEVEHILDESRELEKNRKSVATTLSRQLCIEEEATLSTLIPFIEEQYARRLEEMKDMLNMLSTKIQHTNQRNKFLLENSLANVDRYLHQFVGISNETTDNRRDELVEGGGKSWWS